MPHDLHRLRMSWRGLPLAVSISLLLWLLWLLWLLIICALRALFAH